MTVAFIRHEQMSSHYVDARHVDVWLPPGYAVDENGRFPVLYMHDGQNVFDATSATNGVTWGVAEALTKLIAAGTVPPTIIVAAWHPPYRWNEYLPERPFHTPAGKAYLPYIESQLENQPLQADNYLRFLTSELKPFIDQTYRTRPAQETTFVMGSSMGGLISLYALCEYPHIFAGAGCVSTHWPAAPDLLLDYLKQHLPPPGKHKLYFDYGTETLDSLYEPHQQRADEIMQAAGYTPDQNWLTRKFAGADHSESAWRARVHIPLAFLLSGIRSQER